MLPEGFRKGVPTPLIYLDAGSYKIWKPLLLLAGRMIEGNSAVGRKMLADCYNERRMSDKKAENLAWLGLFIIVFGKWLNVCIYVCEFYQGHAPLG